MADPTPATTPTTDASASSVTTTISVKPGYKTTEFWLSLIAVVLGALVSQGVFANGSEAAKVAGIALIALASLGYTASRAMVKS